jgi:N-acetylmuramoyl-L-alanine amidase
MKLVPLLAMTALLAGCATLPAPPAAPRLDHSVTARGQSDRIKFIVLHYTVSDLPRSVKTLSTTDVSAHYLLTDSDPPFFYTLVDESRQANHAGYSSWKIYNQLNAASIGIEIVNPGFKETPQGRVYAPFQQAQIDQLILLLKDIVKRHNIAPGNIIGHNDIAPQRKQDPGPLFPWKQLADAGLTPWPEASRVAARLPGFQEQLPELAWFQRKLAEVGYAVPQNGELDQATRNVMSVFQTKYRPSLYDGTPDAETAALLDVVTSPVPVVAPAAGAQTIPGTPARPTVPATPATPTAPATPAVPAATPGTPAADVPAE